MKEYFVCKLTTGEEMDFNKRAKEVVRETEDEYIVYDETGNIIGLVQATYAIYFYKTTDGCKEAWVSSDKSTIKEREC